MHSIPWWSHHPRPQEFGKSLRLGPGVPQGSGTQIWQQVRGAAPEGMAVGFHDLLFRHWVRWVSAKVEWWHTLFLTVVFVFCWFIFQIFKRISKVNWVSLRQFIVWRLRVPSFYEVDVPALWCHLSRSYGLANGRTHVKRCWRTHTTHATFMSSELW